MTPLLAQPADRAFERLYRRHAADVYRYALGVLHNPTDAEDVAQTTFMNAFRALQRGERPRAPLNWLISIAHNVCRQRFRQSARRPTEVEFGDSFADVSGEEEDWSAQDIRRALAHLGFNQRAALVLRELEGRSYAEIAEILGLSLPAIEALLFRARRALREQLEGELSCAEAQRALAEQLRGRAAPAEQAGLRAHLRACRSCAGLAKRRRGRRAALGAVGWLPIPLPSLKSLFGGASSASFVGGTAGGVAGKAAAVAAVALVVAGGSHGDRAGRLLDPGAATPRVAEPLLRGETDSGGVRGSPATPAARRALRHAPERAAARTATPIVQPSLQGWGRFEGTGAPRAEPAAPELAGASQVPKTAQAASSAPLRDSLLALTAAARAPHAAAAPSVANGAGSAMANEPAHGPSALETPTVSQASTASGSAEVVGTGSGAPAEHDAAAVKALQAPEKPEAATSEKPQSTTSEKPQPEKSEKQQPDTSHEAPSAPSGNPQPEKSGTPQPEKSEKPQAATSEKPQPTTSEKPQAATGEKPQGDKSEKPQAATSEKPQTDKSEKPQAATGEKPQGDKSEKPEAATSEKPHSDKSDKPQADKNEKPKADKTAKPKADKHEGGGSAAAVPRPAGTALPAEGNDHGQLRVCPGVGPTPEPPLATGRPESGETARRCRREGALAEEPTLYPEASSG